MKSMRLFLLPVAALAMTFSLAVSAQSQTFTTLASFNYTDGSDPVSGSLVQAGNGDYYGTTYSGGEYRGGTAFRIAPTTGLIDIYGFCSQPDCADGTGPWTSFVLGSDGDFYGTTSMGGNIYYSGTIFKMTISGKLTTLYSFCLNSSCTDGVYPRGGLTQASNGNFYGTAYQGGAYGGGSIFEISPAGKFKTLYSFCSKANCTDGSNPMSAPMQASNGNLYGTTYHGGENNNDGTAYEITPEGTFKTLYSFCAQTNCADGAYPVSRLTEGANGSLYGTTEDGGAYGYGTVFEIKTGNEMITLHSFDFTDGAYPGSGVIRANDGNFYGAASGGGVGNGGTIYEVTPSGVFSRLHNFCSSNICPAPGGGSVPSYELMQATDGTFIGTTGGGGIGGPYGTVYSFSTELGPLVKTVPVAAKAGARVIILGNNLTGSTSVTFNGSPAVFTVESDTYITATVPTGATTGTVSVTTPSGVLNSNPSFQVLP
jgi:uncharacterized repeat protein (TIGR03803 family)